MAIGLAMPQMGQITFGKLQPKAGRIRHGVGAADSGELILDGPQIFKGPHPFVLRLQLHGWNFAHRVPSGKRSVADSEKFATVLQNAVSNEEMVEYFFDIECAFIKRRGVNGRLAPNAGDAHFLRQRHQLE